MLLRPTTAAHRVRWAQAVLLLFPAAALPAPWCIAAAALLTIATAYSQAVLRTRRLRLTPQGIVLSGGIFLRVRLRIPFGAWVGLRSLPMPGGREVFLLLPHRTVFLFPMTAAQLALLQSHLESSHES